MNKMDQVQTIEEYKEGLDEYFKFVVELFREYINLTIHLNVSASTTFNLWDRHASRTIREFDLIEKDYKQEWLNYLDQSKLISKADKRLAIIERKKDYEDEISSEIKRISDYAESLLITEKQYPVTDELVRDINKASLEEISNYTINKLLAFWLTHT